MYARPADGIPIRMTREDSGVKDQRGFTEPEHVEAGVAIATPDGNKEQE